MPSARPEAPPAVAFESVLIVGCGNMAGAMLAGWLAAGVPAETFQVHDPALPGLPDGVKALPDLPDGGRFDAVLIGIKPQNLAGAAPAIAPLCGPATIVLSILAAVDLAALAATFPRAKGHVRIMPNLAAALGKSPVGLAASQLDEAQRGAVTRLMQPLGHAEWIAEGSFDLFTALAGSGPAFLYRFIAALAAAAADLGLESTRSTQLAIAMVEGAAALAAASPHDPGVLADMVASPGGVTRAGLAVLDRDDALQDLLRRTLGAARDRSAEMGRD